MYSIEIDCAPGPTRPGDLLPGVLRDTGIALGEPDSKLFGHWTWTIPSNLEARYAEVQAVVKERLLELHRQGRIRYGSW